MKQLTILICLISMSFLSRAQQSDLFKIQTVLNNQAKSWNEGNIPEYMNGYWKSDSLRFIGQTGITYGWKSTLERYQKNYPTRTQMGQLTFTHLNLTKLSADYYFVTGSWHLKRDPKDAGGWFSLLFRKINNHWVIVADHTS